MHATQFAPVSPRNGYQTMSSYFGAPISAIDQRHAQPRNTAVQQSSRKRRLWELPASAHCPVIGVCLPIGESRRILSKVAGRRVEVSDYELHSNLVFRARERNPVAELIQKELDRRYALTLQQFAKLKTSDSVAQAWCEAVNAGDVAGALWATMTHSRCDSELETCVLEDIHMIQHQAGAHARADAKALAQLQAEHRQVREEFERQTARYAKLQNDHSAQVSAMERELAAIRAESSAKDARIEALSAMLQDNKSVDVREHDSRRALVERIDDLRARVRELEATQRDPQRPRADFTELAHIVADPESTTHIDEGGEPTPEPQLTDRAIACVGGRTSAVAAYRELVERLGGRFVHHDGGIEDSKQRLDKVLAAADLVVCQAGCVSHNAYYLVKDFCKRHGKRCIFLDNPSVSSFAKGLRTIQIKEISG